MKIFKWVLALAAAIILLQTLYFKFSGHPSSVAIFSALGMEPAGRYGSGVAELLAGILLLLPGTRAFGALVGLGVISGAIFFHISKLGIELEQLDAQFRDGGTLFFMAIVVWICCALLLLMERRSLYRLLERIKN